MNLAGELVLARNQLLQTVAAKDRGNLDSISARLNQVTSEIQEAVMQTRLQVVETVFSKFPRLVRDLSNALGKQCELVVEGEDVELDKSIIEAIGDPLTHLIRNAVDHGLESPEARAQGRQAAQGKNPAEGVPPGGQGEPCRQRRRRRHRRGQDQGRGGLAGSHHRRAGPRNERPRSAAADLPPRLLHGREAHQPQRPRRGNGRRQDERRTARRHGRRG